MKVVKCGDRYKTNPGEVLILIADGKSYPVQVVNNKAVGLGLNECGNCPLVGLRTPCTMWLIHRYAESMAPLEDIIV